MSDIFNMADTWNNGATVFTAIKMDVTDTASNSASLLLDLLVGASSKFKVDKSGNVTIASTNLTIDVSDGSLKSYGNRYGYFGVNLVSDNIITWSSGSNGGLNFVCTLFREANGVIGVRGATTTTGGALSFIEQTAPSAPSTNGVRIYAVDNGGKTELLALFASGAAQRLAIEP